jgi:hypothetical protein
MCMAAGSFEARCTYLSLPAASRTATGARLRFSVWRLFHMTVLKAERRSSYAATGITAFCRIRFSTKACCVISCCVSDIV